MFVLEQNHSVVQYTGGTSEYHAKWSESKGKVDTECSLKCVL